MYRAVVDFLLAGIGVARPILAPPDMAPGRAAMLQSAFMATMKDPDFLADAKDRSLPSTLATAPISPR